MQNRRVLIIGRRGGSIATTVIHSLECQHNNPRISTSTEGRDNQHIGSPVALQSLLVKDTLTVCSKIIKI